MRYACILLQIQYVECYLKHAKSWLSDFEIGRNDIKKVIDNIKAKLPKETLNEHKCILCGRDVVSVCMYCAFLRTSEVILKLDSTETNIKKSYLDSLNFGLEEEGKEY